MSHNYHDAQAEYKYTLKNISSIILALAELIEEQQQKQNNQNASKIVHLCSDLDWYARLATNDSFDDVLDHIGDEKVIDAYEFIKPYIK